MKPIFKILILIPFVLSDYIFSMYPATPPNPINSPVIKEKKSICAIMPWLCLKTKIKKLLQKGYLIINKADQANYTIDEVHNELIRMLPETEIYPKEEEQQNITPIERLILHLAKENTLKTVTFSKGIDIEQVVVSSSSSSESSSTPSNSPVGSFESDNDLFIMEK